VVGKCSSTNSLKDQKSTNISKRKKEKGEDDDENEKEEGEDAMKKYDKRF